MHIGFQEIWKELWLAPFEGTGLFLKDVCRSNLDEKDSFKISLSSPQKSFSSILGLLLNLRTYHLTQKDQVQLQAVHEDVTRLGEESEGVSGAPWEVSSGG